MCECYKVPVSVLTVPWYTTNSPQKDVSNDKDDPSINPFGSSQPQYLTNIVYFGKQHMQHHIYKNIVVLFLNKDGNIDVIMNHMNSYNIAV